MNKSTNTANAFAGTFFFTNIQGNAKKIKRAFNPTNLDPVKIQYKSRRTPLRTNRRAVDNRGLAKVAVECSEDTFVVNKIWYSTLTFVVKIVTFAKPETVRGNKCTKSKLLREFVKYYFLPKSAGFSPQALVSHFNNLLG